MELSQRLLIEIHKKLTNSLRINPSVQEIQVQSTNDRSVSRPLETFDLTYEAFNCGFSIGKYSARIFLTEAMQIEEIRYPKRIE
jgi:hypothetical protein